MNNLLKAINILNLKENSKINKELTPIILDDKNKTNNLYKVFGFYDLNNVHNVHNVNNVNNKHTCKLYNLQKQSEYCKACNFNKCYLLNLQKIVNLKKNNTNPLCIYLRKKFDKINKLEKLYITETENCTNFKESLKSNLSIYSESKKKLANYNKRKKKIQKQIMFEKNKLLNKRNNYIILFKTIDV